MKLKLTQQNNISILDILEEVSLQNVSVLRAGISKILQSGKNRIVLNLIDAKQLSMDILRELIKLNLIAMELKGSIVLVGQGDLVGQAIKSFSSPPSIKYFSSIEAAVRSFTEESSAVTAQAAPKFDPNDPNGELKQKLAQLEAENKSLKAKLEGRANAEELRKLRFENGVFQQQFTAMEEQLQLLIKERKKPFEMEGMTAKITQLETAMSEFLEKEGLLGKK